MIYLPKPKNNIAGGIIPKNKFADIITRNNIVGDLFTKNNIAGDLFTSYLFTKNILAGDLFTKNNIVAFYNLLPQPIPIVLVRYHSMPGLIPDNYSNDSPNHHSFHTIEGAPITDVFALKHLQTRSQAFSTTIAQASSRSCP